MKYTPQEIIQFVEEEDVKFIRLAFCDVFGRPKNISINSEELERAFKYGIAFDASAIAGFGNESHSDLFLHPDPDTLAVLPWRPEHGRVVRMYCTITYPDGRIFENDTRSILKQAVAYAAQAGYTFRFGAEMEFYLFKLDDSGNPTAEPNDRAGYMDVAPEDRGENIRREICLTLEQMGIQPESSHHEEGPGQNEIDFRYSDALAAADNAVTFQTVVKTIAARSGLWADFSPKPLPELPGSGLHINISVKGGDQTAMPYMIGGILRYISDITAFLNPTEQSYQRLGAHKAPKYISWSSDNRSQLIRVPAATGEYRRMELRSADPAANPYLAFTLLIYAGLYGIQNQNELPSASNVNFFTASEEELARYETLPRSLEEAVKIAAESPFIREHLPATLVDFICKA